MTGTVAKVMTDGCGFVNLAALLQIASWLGFTSRNTAFQGRIAGAKGMWLLHLDDRLSTAEPKIWIRDSQDKIKLPDLATCDHGHLILDFVAPARMTLPVQLSAQILINLAHNGVPHAVLKTLLEEGLKAEVADLTWWSGPESMLLLYHAVSRIGNVTG